MKNAIFSFCGLGLGAVALLMALFHFYAGPLEPTLTLEQSVAKTAVEIKNATVAALKGEEFQTPTEMREYSKDQIFSTATAILGGIAIILGALGFALKEPARVASGAAVLGVGAIIFQFAAMAVGIFGFVILVAVVLFGLLSFA